MKKICIYTTILMVLFLLVDIRSTFAQSDPVTDPPVIDLPGILEDTGTFFAVTDSEYLNVTVDSSELIHLRLESIPQMVVMIWKQHKVPL